MIAECPKKELKKQRAARARAAWEAWEEKSEVSATTASSERPKLTEDEEREARKVEKKLKEITSLELRRAEGDHLDALQLAKLDRRSELERNHVMQKVRDGYLRPVLFPKANWAEVC